MAKETEPQTRLKRFVGLLFYLVAAGFTFQLFNYYLFTAGGPTLLAFTLVPVTFVLFVLDALRKDALYPRLGVVANHVIGLIYSVLAVSIGVYMVVEFENIGTVRAGFWNNTDLLLGGAMFVLVMEFARKRYFELFVLNLVLILYAVYGWIVPGMFSHPGLSWKRIVTSMSLETTTGVYSSLPQLALTLIGSFILVLSALRSFGAIHSILKATSRLATRSRYALPQTAVMGSFAVAAVSGSGAANAVTTGSATIPALIEAGMPREDAAAIEAAASLGGQLMPPVMGISAFLMADFLGRSYFDVVARGYAPAMVYFVGVAMGVYLLAVRYGTGKVDVKPASLSLQDWSNLTSFLIVVAGLILLMAVLRLPPIFAALYVFAGIFTFLFGATLLRMLRSAEGLNLRRVGRPLLEFIDNFAVMTAELTLLLCTLSILTGAFVNTGVPTKVGFILVSAADVNLAAMALVAFFFGALLGMGLPPAPTYILTALVIAPHMIRAGMDPWPVHFFAFFLAVWGELTPPTSVVAAVTSKIADANFLGTLWRAIKLCLSLFVLMAAVFVHPELVLEPGWNQIVSMLLIMVVTVGITFSLQARFSNNVPLDIALRVVLFGLAMLILFDADVVIGGLACIPVLGYALYWFLKRKSIEELRPA